MRHDKPELLFWDLILKKLCINWGQFKAIQRICYIM